MSAVQKPKESSFENAVDFLARRVGECFSSKDEFEKKRTRLKARLVHGILRAEDGTEFCHAWVEENGFAWNAEIRSGRLIYNQRDRGQFHRQFRVKYWKAYTIRRLIQLEEKHGHTGPWEPKFMRLCPEFNGD